MQIAVIADIHGNLAALEAVLADLERLRPDMTVVNGDVVDGAPDSAACWERVLSLGYPVLRGNHERYVFDFDTERADPVWKEPQFAPLHFTIKQLNRKQIAAMATLPLVWASPDAPDLLLTHASPRSDADTLLPHTPAARADALFAGTVESAIVRSHNHICGIREWRGKRIVTTGAVGLPLDGNPRAQYCLLTRRQGVWTVEHRAVPYDVEATLRRFRDSGYLEAAGAIGRLFMREVMTGTSQVVPFLRYLGQRRNESSGLTAQEALAGFFDGVI